MKILNPFLNKLDREKLKDILSMEKAPQDQARHMIEQYKNEAPTVAQDLIDLFADMDEKVSEEYWREVRTCMNNLETRH